MSKLFHCRCAVAINFAKSNKIIAFDESHIEDVRVELSGFTTAVGSVLQGAKNPSFVGGRYATRDSTASVTLNETVLDASWVTLLDTSYTQLGGSAVNLINKKERDQLESIYGVTPENISGVINVPASQLVSDPAFKTDDAIKVILESQGRGDRQPSPTQPQEQDISKVRDADGFKTTLKNLLKIYKEGDPLAKDRIDVLLTVGRKKGFIPDIGRETPPSTRPPQATQQPPQTRQAQDSYGVIVLAMDHSPPRVFGGGADNIERTKTDIIAQKLKEKIEAKEPKIKVIIVKPEDKVKIENFGPGKAVDAACPGKTYDNAWDPYDNYIINEYVNKKQNKATIISVHLDAPRSEGGKGAAVWNLSPEGGVTNVSEKLSNIIEGTYIKKFKEIGGQKKVPGVQRKGKCDVRSIRIYKDAPEGYALVEFGIFREVPDNVDQFFVQQKEAFDALVDGLIDFKRSFGTSKDVEGANGSSSSAPAEQTAIEPKLPEVGEVPGLLISFWYDVNNYVTKVDYYFIITAASISYGDGTPKLNINAVSAYSVIFNTWKIQDSFAAGSPIDEVLRKVFSSDPTGTYTRDKVEIDKPAPEEKLFEQEDLAGLTYNEFKSKLARKFDLQFLASPRADQLGKIKVFREPRVGAYTGSQVFWLGRGLFEKYDISVVSEYNAVNAVGAPNSSYSRNSDSIRFNAPFSSSQRIEFQMPSGQPSMIFKYNGSQYTASKLPPAGWERIQTPGGQNGIQLVLKLPNGETWPKSGNIEMHNLAESRPGRGTKSIALWDPTSKTFQIKSGSIHAAVDGGIFPNPGGKLISYFKGVVEQSDPEDGQVTIKYNRWVSLSIDGRVGEYQIYMTHLHLANRIPRGTQVDVGTVIGTQDGIGGGGARTYDPHMHEEFYINTPGNKTLYLDPFIVYSYSYSRDNNGNKVFDSAARVSQVATGSNNANSGYQQGGGSIQQQMLMKTEFAGIPRALQILPGQTFLHFVTDYNRYLKFDDRDKPNIDPGIPIIRQLQDWMIAKCSFNWAGDLRVSLECYRPRIDAPIYAGQNWESYRKSPGGKGPALDDYYDYMRSIGDLFYTTVDENGQIISSAKKPFQATWAVTGEANPNNNIQPTAINGKCKYTGNAYSTYKNNIDTIIAQLERAGLNKVALSGILGNISVESTFGTSIIGRGTCGGGSKTERATDSNGNSVTIGPNDCWGIVQWSSDGDRRGRALRATNSDGKNIAGQANFVVEELRTSEKRCTKKFSGEVVQLLNSAASPTQAAEIFRACYERGEGLPAERGRDAETIFKGLTCEG